MNESREEDERIASKRAAAAISAAAEADGGDNEAFTRGDEDAKRPRTLLEAAKELKKATANMDASTIRQMKAKEEEHRMLREANQASQGRGVLYFGRCVEGERGEGVPASCKRMSGGCVVGLVVLLCFWGFCSSCFS